MCVIFMAHHAIRHSKIVGTERAYLFHVPELLNGIKEGQFPDDRNLKVHITRMRLS